MCEKCTKVQTQTQLIQITQQPTVLTMEENKIFPDANNAGDSIFGTIFINFDLVATFQ